MTHKHIFNAVDRMLRDVRHKITGAYQIPFGGVPTMFGGDFQQTLPILSEGQQGRANTVAACLQYAAVWPSLKIRLLTTSLLLRGSIASAQMIRCKV
ncbi:hypothetical protein N7535_008344 [Penicillium sp. DV-2018c]|nr:hypothetical protein N7461_002101 [Penicillium sp. DV-2018c]KAJ5563180.1 hypothetical protein N7535_008344 [Penicillium sp. DV-2018c]